MMKRVADGLGAWCVCAALVGLLVGPSACEQGTLSSPLQRTREDLSDLETRLVDPGACLDYRALCERAAQLCATQLGAGPESECDPLLARCQSNLAAYCATHADGAVASPDGAADHLDSGVAGGDDTGVGAIADGAEPDATAPPVGGCGDGVCEAAEDCQSCAADCGPCAPTYDCLQQAAEVKVITGHHKDKLEPSAAPGRAFDGRAADFLVTAKWGMIDVVGDSGELGMCWAGGYITSDKPWDASWDDHKDLDGPTRNSAAISNRATEMVVTGVHFFNVHDGDRTSNATSWVIQHNWGEYVRDDCVENDHQRSGRIIDTLYDGCYTGISTRPSSSDSESHGAGQVVELDRVLLRLQPMPYPYKWTTKSGVIDASGKPYAGVGVPYSHGNLFKLSSDDVARNPHFRIHDSVFAASHLTTADKLNLPPEELLDACSNNTIVWLGGGPYPGKLPDKKFPGCFTILTGQPGRDFWRAKVIDWHARHPDVDPARKPAAPGAIVFPQIF